MLDREKVIKEYEFMVRDFCPACTSDERYLEVMKAVLDLLKEQEAMMQCIKGKCRTCPHCTNCDVDENGMIKEQEAVKPYVTGRGESFESAETWWYECGNCNKPIDPNDKYCRHCGRSVKWE